MASVMQNNVTNVEKDVETEDVCVLCCKKIDIYAIGTCDHPVCYECSTRMRVLCKQNECPICRRDMLKVVFTETKDSFQKLMDQIYSKRNILLQDKSIGVIFETNTIQKAYFKLLEHRCPICNNKNDVDKRFRTFNELKEHVRKEHELFYCELCVANLKIFSNERRCYTRQERAQHRRKGDPDDKSHRGHPLCQFCDTRYMDFDELFRHLRRDHFYCHFCDMESNVNQFYNNYDDLREHFLQEHYVCEEGNCKNEQFLGVFKSLIDLKAHRASVHSRDLGKMGTKQARTVEVAFTLKPRPGKQRVRRRVRDQDSEYEEEGAVGYESNFVDTQNSFDFPQLCPADSNSSSITFKHLNRGLNSEDFPQLGMSDNKSSVTFTRYPNREDRRTLTQEDFPQLGGSDRPLSENRNQNTSITVTRNRPASEQSKSTISFTKRDDFPQLSQKVKKLNNTYENSVAGTSKTNNTLKLSISKRNQPETNLSIRMSVPMSSTVQVRPKWNEFPVLGGGKNDVEKGEPPKWGKTNKSGKNGKEVNGAVVKVNPEGFKKLKQNELNQKGLDFPELTNQKKDEAVKKRSTVTLECVSNPNDKETKKGGETKKKNDNKSVKKKKKGHESDDSKSESNNNNNNNVSNESKTEEEKVKKKLSELKIDRLRNDLEIETKIKNPPPGFSVKPPPGFEGCKNVQLSGMTFTNSTGQSFPILASTTAGYKPPKDFEKRNEMLIKNLNQVTNGDLAGIIEFKRLSALFRSGEYPPKDYYNLCLQTMKEHFDKLFPELLILLPDVTKQNELYKEHVKRGDTNRFEICLKCDQVVLKRDLSEHLMTHALETNFPLLDSSAAEMNNYWRK